MEKKFNLLENPWIKAVDFELKPKELSFRDIFIDSHEYLMLAGETATQDASICRLLLAGFLSIFYRYDEYGNRDEISEENNSDMDAVIERWNGYWKNGKIPEKAVVDYFDNYRERFWLFHPNTPFYQIADSSYGTKYKIECLIGNIKESNNKESRHHFSMRELKEPSIGFNEAARWLIHLNAYGVNIKKDNNAPGMGKPVGAGRLGQLGFVMATGKSLFHTLMLNLCPLKNDMCIWGTPKPVWEYPPCMEQGNEIAPPDNLPELYTIQSRRIFLVEDNNSVVGCMVMGGDFYSVENDFNEPMTLWKKKKSDSADEKDTYAPLLHSHSVHAWKEFPALVGDNTVGHMPGIVQWICLLCRKRLISNSDMLTFRMIGIEYDKMRYKFENSIDNSLTLSSGLFADFGTEWSCMISREVIKCRDKVRMAISSFAGTVSKIFNEKKGNFARETLLFDYFSHIDIGFRRWLLEIKPEQENYEDERIRWEKESFRYAKQCMTDYLEKGYIDIYAYREYKGKNLTVLKALNHYGYELNQIYHGIWSDVSRTCGNSSAERSSNGQQEATD